MQSPIRNALLALSIVSTAYSHLFINSPTPIEGTNVKPPLDESGLDWPCHGVSLPSSGGQVMTAGSNQTLSWDLGGGANWAVHGGGSCQMSVTYETDPQKQKDPANWKVIYSIEGGCPSDTSQNLDGPGAYACNSTNFPNCVNSFNFTIPTGLKDGHVIMAWTWYNTIGNRETYMNCINADIEGGDGSEMDDLPPLFVANLAGVGECPTTQSMNLQFPSPGKYVAVQTQVKLYPLAVPTGPGCPVAASGVVPSGANYSAPAITMPAASAPEATLPVATPSAVISGMVVAPSSTLASGSGTSAGSCTTGQTACQTPGSIICIDSTHFGTCNTNHCAISQEVAAGTTCSNGHIMRKRQFRS